MIENGFATRFPTIAAACHAHGIDPDREPIPVRPAEHYHMGGIDVDADGRASVEGLWACGEVARTGLHGANRLASNSLLEAMVCARTVAASVAAAPVRAVRAVAVPRLPAAPDPASIRALVSSTVGVLRDRAGLVDGIEALAAVWRAERAPPPTPPSIALMIAVAALDRRESRGGHTRTDWPEADPWQARSRRLTLADALAMADYATARVAA